MPADVIAKGADPAGISDSTPAFFAAVADGGEGQVRRGVYRLAQKFVLSEFGQKLIATDGFGSATLIIDHTDGAGVCMAAPCQEVRDFFIDASESRQVAATNVALAAISIGGAEAGSKYTTFAKVGGIVARWHPGHGVYMGRESPGAILEHVSADSNRGHGFYLDDGTEYGASAIRRNGIVTLNSCRATENGGNGLNISQNGSTSYRIVVNQFETISNVWNNDIASLLPAQAVIRGQNVSLNECAWDDSLYQNSATRWGTPRTPRSAMTDGWQLRNGSSEVFIRNNRYLNLLRCGFVRTGVNGFLIDDAYSDALKQIGFRIESGVLGARIRLSNLSYYTTAVYSETPGIRAEFAGQEVILATASGAYFRLHAITNGNIASNTVNAQSSVVLLRGQNDAADDLQCIVMAGGTVPVPDGLTVGLVNKNAYPITIKHGLTNLFTKTNADIVLGQNDGISFVSDGENLYQV